MAANYPNSLPSAKSRTDSDMSQATTHTDWHDQDEEEIIAIATELGTTPSGSYSTVKARLEATPVLLDSASAPSGTISFSPTETLSNFSWVEVRGRVAHDDTGGNAYRAISVRLNGDSGSNYQYQASYEDQTGSRTISAPSTGQTGMLAGYAGDVFGMFSIMIPVTGTRKTAISKGVAAIGGLWTNGVRQFSIASEWIDTGDVTSVSVIGFGAGADWVASSVVDLYGWP